VKLGQLATVLPGRGLVAFTAMVVFTILASASSAIGHGFAPVFFQIESGRNWPKPEW